MNDLNIIKIFYCTHNENVFKLEANKTSNAKDRVVWNVILVRKSIHCEKFQRRAWSGFTIREALRGVGVIKSSKDPTPTLYDSLEVLAEDNIEIFL